MSHINNYKGICAFLALFKSFFVYFARFLAESWDNQKGISYHLSDLIVSC